MHACGEDISHIALPVLPSAVAWARRHTESSLRAWQLSAHTIETARLVVSELVTNAVRAEPDNLPTTGARATNPAAQVILTLWLLPGQVAIEVSDSQPGWRRGLVFRRRAPGIQAAGKHSHR